MVKGIDFLLKIPKKFLDLVKRKCNRCGYVWILKIQKDGTVDEPYICAGKKCKSPYWNKARVRF